MRRVTRIFVFVLLIANGSILQAYDTQTHRAIAERAAQPLVSSLDQVLKSELGLPGGITESFRGISQAGSRRVEQLIGDGAEFEDVPDTRSLNHFHNPLAEPWDGAGLRALLGSIRGQSSVLWQQNTTQDTTTVFTPILLPSGGGNWSWQDTRRHYLNVLTRATKEDRGNEPGRDRAFAEMFETLGHLTHLIQDASVPAHVRNDPHLIFDGYEARIEELRASPPGSAPRLRFESFLSLDPRFPSPSIFTPTGDLQAPVPIARLIDSDTYRGDDILTYTTGGLIGVAEYTNGGYVSDDTIFLDFPFPSSASLGPGFCDPPPPSPPCAPGSRLYFPKVTDGDFVSHFVAEGSLFERLRFRGQLFGGVILEDRTYEAAATLLLPRAVGYSAKLLDHFFRGKLEVDLVEDLVDPSLIRLTGTNASTDPLVDGTLTLYADDPTGRRDPVLTLEPMTIANVAPGQEVSSAGFQAPENAERFVAVYQGTLGLEKKDGTFPGGVIGKVLGGVRVEEVFADFDGDRWKIRTPKGVFLLQEGDRPLTRVDFAEVKWGDGENLLVARTSFGLEEATRFVAYELERQPNSVEFKTVDTPDGPAVVLRKKSEAAFPFGTPLGTTVEFTQTIQYRQQLGRYDRTAVLRWEPNPLFPSCPECGQYIGDHTELGPLEIETVKAQPVGFSESFPLVLDLAHNDSVGSVNRPYVWDLQEVAVDASGRLLGLVRAEVTSPTSPAVRLPFFSLNRQGELFVGEGCLAFQCFPQEVFIGPSFPVQPTIWALVDLQMGQVIDSTADSLITISSVEALEADPWTNFFRVFPPDIQPGVWTHVLERREGGPEPGLVDHGWFKGSLRRLDDFPGTPVGERTELQAQDGVQGASATFLRAELQAELSRLGLLSFAIERDQLSFDFIYDCGSTSCSVVRVVRSTSRVVRIPAQLQEAVRSRPAPGGERLVFVIGGAVLVWDPAAPRAQVLLHDPRELHFLGPATRTTVLVFSGEGDESLEVSMSLIPLEGTQEPVVFPPGENLSAFFTLLDPSFLYNVDDMKFYRLKPPLQRTALPAKLVDVPFAFGDFHAVRLP